MNFLNCWVGIARHGTTAQMNSRDCLGTITIHTARELFYKGEGWMSLPKKSFLQGAESNASLQLSSGADFSPLLDAETVESKTGGKLGCVTRFTKTLMMMLKGKWMTMV